MNEKTHARVITLEDLWVIFLKRFWIMVLAAVFCAGGAFWAVRLTFVPRYESTAVLYILRQDGSDTVTGSSDDFSLALKVVNDCDYILKSHSVLDEVIHALSFNISYEELAKTVSTSNPDSTRILEVTVEADTPQAAKEIVDAVCEIGQEKIAEAMGFNQVNLYEYGTLNGIPCNRTGILAFLVLGFTVAVLVYAFFLILFLLDDKIRTEEDIERYLGLSLLGDIPNAEEGKNGKYGYFSAYGSKQKSASQKGGRKSGTH